ncbi:type II secretion system protein GspL [Legionella londiniensis]|uniref:Type II secretion system protein L n=1 Tax=Legionella londiniensis TaxID=45068 RepID=A0A0W0VPA9_9GAMM|nr:type II secretion system protein GspL [Legionella londiniensis]KTD21916.1 general secretion pathway protein L [Legionella londiniensis]STX92601.1 general secretion pathway protein L [Legionella londiniensis]
MATWYLFAKQLGEDQFPVVKIDSSGRVEEALTIRTVEDIQAITAGARTVIVLPTDICSLHEVELPWLGERKTRAAIPYALEEQVAQNIESLHFAFDRKHYKDNRYLVAAVDKAILSAWVEQFERFNIRFEILTIDWFALQLHEAFIREQGLLVHEPFFKGVLSTLLAKQFFKKKPPGLTVISCADSDPQLTEFSNQSIDEDSHTWIAQRLNQADLLNFCQGELQREQIRRPMSFWYLTGSILFGLWLLSFLVMKGLEWYTLNHEIKRIDQQIAQIYRQFFPNARQIVNPKFRISQLLKSSAAGSEKAFWLLYAKLSQSLDIEGVQVEMMRYQNQALNLRLTARDFSTLEALQNKLQQSGVAVRQTQASLKENQVLATLELTL